jgi:hypothetical protein
VRRIAVFFPPRASWTHPTSSMCRLDIGASADVNGLMAPNKTRTKPTGELGSLEIGPGKAQYVAGKLPNEKDAIEMQVLVRAIEAGKSRGVDLYNLASDPEQNRRKNWGQRTFFLDDV